MSRHPAEQAVQGTIAREHAAESGEPLRRSVVSRASASRRRPRGEAGTHHVAAFSEALENLRHTVRFLQELMMNRQAEAHRALQRAHEDLEDLRQRIRWVEELAPRQS